MLPVTGIGHGTRPEVASDQELPGEASGSSGPGGVTTDLHRGNKL